MQRIIASFGVVLVITSIVLVRVEPDKNLKVL